MYSNSLRTKLSRKSSFIWTIIIMHVLVHIMYDCVCILLCTLWQMVCNEQEVCIPNHGRTGL